MPYQPPGPDQILDGNGDPYSSELPSSVDYGFDLDFESEAPFAREPDAIQEDFSLGVIVWHPALPTKRALPSTFAEAELEALAPRKPLSSDDESISEYFINERDHENFLSVRQTDTWAEIKDDLIFVEFSEVCDEIIPMERLIANRNRPDPNWSAPELVKVPSPTPTPEPSQASTPSESHDYQKMTGQDGEESGAGDMDLDGSQDDASQASVKLSPDPITAQPSVLDNLEQALFSTEADNGQRKPVYQVGRTNGVRTARAGSQQPQHDSYTTTRPTRPKALPPIRDRNQEDLLASLGVTGSPKLVYQTPGPAIAPPRANSAAPDPRNNPMYNYYGGLYAPPPPPMNQRSPSYDPWRAHEHSRSNGYDYERPNSVASQHTLPGSDFNPEDKETTPRPSFNRMDSRKRAYDDEDELADDGKRRQVDDTTPRARRKTQPRVAAAYG